MEITVSDRFGSWDQLRNAIKSATVKEYADVTTMP